MNESSVKVGVRVRPLISREKGDQYTIEPQDYNSLTFKNQPYTFDYVFGMDLSQDSLYQQTAAPMMQSFLDGYNCTIMAYGQTGSGKTFTMGTSDFHHQSKTDQGIIPRFINDLFEYFENMSNKNHFFKIKMSFLEIYGEDVYDLLNISSSSSRASDFSNRQSLSIREDEHGKVFVQGQTEIDVNSSSVALDVLHLGSQNRVTASTAMNSVSSRSHAVLTVYLEQKIKKKIKKEKRMDEDEELSCRDEENDDEEEEEEEEKEEIITSKLTFVDLAGSERIKKTGAEGQRMKEGIQINSGLFNLGHVINLLADDQKIKINKEKNINNFIPYRNSKLTHLLKDSLGGNSQTFFLACVSPSDNNEQETMSTLNYARQARNIKNKPIKNKKKSQQDEIKKLRISMKVWMNTALSIFYNQLNTNNIGNANIDENLSNSNFTSPVSKKSSNIMTPSKSSQFNFVYKPLTKIEEESILKNVEVQSFISSVNSIINEKIERNSSTPRNLLSSPLPYSKINSPGRPSFFNGKKVIRSSTCYDLGIIKEEEKKKKFKESKKEDNNEFSPFSLLKSAEYIEEMMGTSENLVEDLKNILQKEKKLLTNSNIFHSNSDRTAGKKRLSSEVKEDEQENEEDNDEFDEDIDDLEISVEENEEIVEIEKLISEKEVILEQLDVFIKKNNNLRDEIDKIVENINNLEEEKKLLESELNKLKSSSISNTSSTSYSKINERYLLIKNELEKMKNDKKDKESAYKVIEKNQTNYILLEKELSKLKDSKKLLLKEKKKQDLEMKQLKNENNNHSMALKKLDRKNNQLFQSINTELSKKNRLIIIKNKEINKLNKKIKVMSDHLCQILSFQAKNRNGNGRSALPNTTLKSTGLKKEFSNVTGDISYFFSSKNLLEEIINNKIEFKLLRNLYQIKLNDLEELNKEVNKEILELNEQKNEKSLLLKEHEEGTFTLSFSNKFQLENINHKISMSEYKIESLSSRLDACSNEIEEIKFRIDENNQNRNSPLPTSISLSSSLTISSAPSSLSSSQSSKTSSNFEDEINWELICQEIIKDLNTNQLQILISELLTEKINLKVKIKEIGEEIKKVNKNFSFIFNNIRVINEKSLSMNEKLFIIFNKIDEEKLIQIKNLFLENSVSLHELPVKKIKKEEILENSAEINKSESILLNKLYELKNLHTELNKREKSLSEEYTKKVLENLVLLEKNKDLKEELEMNLFFKERSNDEMKIEEDELEDLQDKNDGELNSLLSYILENNNNYINNLQHDSYSSSAIIPGSLILSSFSQNYLATIVNLFNTIGYSNSEKIFKLKNIIYQIKKLKLVVKNRNISFISSLNNEINDEIFSLTKYFYFFYFSSSFLTQYFKFVQNEREQAQEISSSSLIENSNKIFTLKLLKHIKNNFIFSFFSYIKRFYILKKNFYYLKKKMLINYSDFFLDEYNNCNHNFDSNKDDFNYSNLKLFYYFSFNFSKKFLLFFSIMKDEEEYNRFKQYEEEEQKELKELELFNKKEYSIIMQFKNDKEDEDNNIHRNQGTYLNNFSEEFMEIDSTIKNENDEENDNQLDGDKLEIKKEMNYFVQHFVKELKCKEENQNNFFLQDLEFHEANSPHDILMNEQSSIQSNELYFNNTPLKNQLLESTNSLQVTNFLNQFFNKQKTFSVFSSLEKEIKNLNIERIKINSFIISIRNKILINLKLLEFNKTEEVQENLEKFFNQILMRKNVENENNFSMDIDYSDNFEFKNVENCSEDEFNVKEIENIYSNYKKNNNNIQKMFYFNTISNILTVSKENFPQGNNVVKKLLIKLNIFLENIKKNRLILVNRLIRFFYSSFSTFKINTKYLSFLNVLLVESKSISYTHSVIITNLLKKETIQTLLSFFSQFYEQIFLNFNNLKKKINTIMESIEEKRLNQIDIDRKVQSFIQLKITELKSIKIEDKSSKNRQSIQQIIDSFFSFDISTCSILSPTGLHFSPQSLNQNYDEKEITLTDDFFINLTEKELNFEEKEKEYHEFKEKEKDSFLQLFENILTNLSNELNDINKEEIDHLSNLKNLKDDEQLVIVATDLIKEFNKNHHEQFIQSLNQNISKRLILNEEKIIKNSKKIEEKTQKKFILTLFSFQFLLNEVMYLYFLYYLFNLLKKNDESFHKHVITLKEYEETIKVNRKKALSGNSRQLLIEEKERNKNKKKYQVLSEKLLTIYSKIYSIIILNDKNYFLNESPSIITASTSSSIHIEVLPNFTHLSEDGQVLIKEGVSKERLDLMRLNSNSYSSYNKEKEKECSISSGSNLVSSSSSNSIVNSSKQRPPPPPPSISRSNSIPPRASIISSSSRTRSNPSLLRSPKGKNIFLYNNTENDSQYSNLN